MMGQLLPTDQSKVTISEGLQTMILDLKTNRTMMQMMIVNTLLVTITLILVLKQMLKKQQLKSPRTQEQLEKKSTQSSKTTTTWMIVLTMTINKKTQMKSLKKGTHNLKRHNKLTMMTLL